jgi:hypothetical protein
MWQRAQRGRQATGGRAELICLGLLRLAKRELFVGLFFPRVSSCPGVLCRITLARCATQKASACARHAGVGRFSSRQPQRDCKAGKMPGHRSGERHPGLSGRADIPRQMHHRDVVPFLYSRVGNAHLWSCLLHSIPTRLTARAVRQMPSSRRSGHMASGLG